MEPKEMLKLQLGLPLERIQRNNFNQLPTQHEKDVKYSNNEWRGLEHMYIFFFLFFFYVFLVMFFGLVYYTEVVFENQE